MSLPPAQRPGRLLRRALKWMFLAIVAVFVVVAIPAAIDGIVGGLATARGQTVPPPFDLGKLGPYSAIALQIMLFWGAIRGARAADAGNVAAGLANRPIERSRLIVLFAALILIWDLAVISALGWIVSQGGRIPALPKELAEMPNNLVVAVIHIAFLGLIAPIAEEMFFRGWLWTALRKSWSPTGTLCWTGFLWLIMHAVDGTARALLLLPIGILLGLARHFGNSVRASLILHLMNNGIVVMLQIAALVATGRTAGP